MLIKTMSTLCIEMEFNPGWQPLSSGRDCKTENRQPLSPDWDYKTGNKDTG